MPKTSIMSDQPDFEQSKESPKRSRYLVSFLEHPVFGILGLTAPFVFTRSPLPFMATPSTKMLRALAFLRDKHGCRNHFVDMGSGDGEAVCQALLAGSHMAVGVELNRTLHALSLCRRFFWISREKQKSNADLFGYSVDKADTVMIFGVTPLMKDLSKKLTRETRPGRFVLSYRFPISTAESGNNNDHLHALKVYDEEEMRIYQVVK